MKKYSLHVQGTHCNSCKVLIEETLIEQKDVSSVKVNLRKQIIEVEGDFESTPEEISKLFSDILAPHKYSVSAEKIAAEKDLKSLMYALPIGLIVLALFFLLQKSGIINFGFEGGLTPWTALLIGLIASVSTCLAVVGGLILSLSAQVSQDTSSFRPFSFFHIGRLVSFMILGGALGAIGSAVAINDTITAVLGLIAAFVMIILGINLLNIFHFTKSFQLALPKGIFTKLSKIENGFWAPFIVGAITFFLPCGFTQSMQIAALSSGSWLQGSLIMTMFALGTLPMLVLISFSSFKFAHTKYASIFFKSAGIIVIGLGLFAFLAGLAGLGLIKPIFNI
ncbi:sulfite exporter TauE/SafE family protein [Candidatus Peregrinibacteria bacterium]|nr:sulfite exporter TauE/SafE family protein [Candidatus Peregrinibacteria bacterium]